MTDNNIYNIVNYHSQKIKNLTKIINNIQDNLFKKSINKKINILKDKISNSQAGSTGRTGATGATISSAHFAARNRLASFTFALKTLDSLLEIDSLCACQLASQSLDSLRSTRHQLPSRSARFGSQ